MCDLLTCLSDCLSRCSQYSLQEDKYESAIRDLTDKLKEVRTLVPSSLVHQSGTGDRAAAQEPTGGSTPLTAGHMTPVLPSRHWLPVKSRLCFQVLLCGGPAPSSLEELAAPDHPSRALCSPTAAFSSFICPSAGGVPL